MDGITLRLMAQVMGLTIMSFCVDFKLPDGRDQHRAVQVMGTSGNESDAAAGIYREFLRSGLSPRAITHYPGDYIMDELEAAMDVCPQMNKGVPVYIAADTIYEAQARN